MKLISNFVVALFFTLSLAQTTTDAKTKPHKTIIEKDPQDLTSIGNVDLRTKKDVSENGINRFDRANSPVRANDESSKSLIKLGEMKNKQITTKRETPKEDEETSERPRIRFSAPLYTDELKGALVPLTGSLVIKWYIEPKIKAFKRIDIVLIKNLAYPVKFLVASKLSKSTNNFTWNVDATKVDTTNQVTLSVGDNYKLWIHESGKNHDDVDADIIPAATPIFIFQPADVSHKFDINGSPFNYWPSGSIIIFFTLSACFF